MKIFKLPDLGEGLPDAIIREWYIKVGDEVTVDQPIVAMETAKALVDVPAPFDARIEKLFGEPGTTIETGEPLIGFEGEGEEEAAAKDSGTVVGAIEESNTVLAETATGVARTKSQTERVKATPAVRSLAKKLGVTLADVVSQGPRITADDVKRAAEQKAPSAGVADEGMQTLSPIQRAMVLSMTQAHQEVVPVTLCDDADIHAWNDQQNILIRLIRAIVAGCEAEPMLNAHFDSKNLSYRLNQAINLGVAVDTPHGLYVPVIKDIAQQNDSSLRSKVDQYKKQAQEKTIAQDDLHGATIMLSNFGTFAGRYANPVLTPPMVAIIGVGKSRDTVVAVNKQPEIHRIIPLSITCDHRIITGGQMARFLKVMIESLEQ